MNGVVVGEGSECNKAIIAENAVIGNGCFLGYGEEKENELDPRIYNAGLVTIGEKTVVPDNIKIGKNTVVMGETVESDYKDNELPSGKFIVKAGDEA